MVLSKSLNKIEGNKIYLRKLRIKDANKNYLSWFYDKTTRKYIISAKSTVTIKTLKELKAAGYASLGIKAELRKNLLKTLKKSSSLQFNFDGFCVVPIDFFR